MIAPRHVDVVQGTVANPSVWVTWDRSDHQVTKYEVLRHGSVIGTVGPFTPYDPADPAHQSWFAPSGYPAEVLADDPAYYFRKEETTGYAMVDSGPNGLTANTEKPFGTPAALPNVVGPITNQDANNAKTYNGVDERFVIANHAALDVATGAWSIELWVKRSATQGVTQSLWQRASGGPLVKFHTDNKVRLRKNGTGDVLDSSIAITDTNWHHIVVVKPAAAEPLIYIDGVDRTGTLLLAGQTYTDSTSFVQMGGGSTPFAGSIDEPALYGSALSAARVAAHFNAATAAPVAQTPPFDDTWDKCAFQDTTVVGGQTYAYTVRPYVGAIAGPASKAARIKVEGDGDYGPARQVAAPSGGDDTATLNAAIATAESEGGIAILQAGTYLFTQLSHTGKRSVLRGQGDTTRLRPFGAGGASSGAGALDQITVAGSVVALTATLSAAITPGQSAAQFSAVGEISVGSVVALTAPATGGTALDMFARGDTLTPGAGYDEGNRVEVNEVTAIDGLTVTFRYPFTQQMPVDATLERLAEPTVGNRQRGVVFENLSIEGVSATDTTFFTNFETTGLVGARWANVRSQWTNSSVVNLRADYDCALVGCREPDHGAIEGEIVQYSVSVNRAANTRIVACDFGTDEAENLVSCITTQRAPRTLMRHCRVFWPRNYAFNEHGGGSRDWICENNLFRLRKQTAAQPTVYGGVFLGNPSWANAGRGIVRNNRQDNGPNLVSAREHSYGVRVLDNIAYNLEKTTGPVASLVAALVVWGGWDSPHEDPANWGAARLAVRRNALFGSTDRGVWLGRQASSYFGDGTAGNPDPAGDGLGYLGVKDAILADNHLEASAARLFLAGDSTATKRFQVTGTTGTVKDTKPAFVAGDWWANNGDGESYGAAVAVDWADEFFAWELAPSPVTSGIRVLVNGVWTDASLKILVNGAWTEAQVS